MSDVVKENPCIKCTNYDRNRKCYCSDFEKYYPYQQGKAEGRADAIDDAIEIIGNNFDMQELYLPIHIMEKLQQLKEQKNE